MTVGEKIRKIRTQHGMTQRQLAEACGMKATAIGRYERGGANPKLETIQKIAIALDVSLFDITGFETFNNLIEESVDEKIKRMIDEREVTPLPASFVSDYAKLNNIGKREAEKRVHELTEISRYVNDSKQSPNNKD